MRATRLICLSLFLGSLVGLGASCGDDGKEQPPVTKPACDDGMDNDGDGKVDFPEDPGCSSAEDTDEEGLALPSCSDNRDNDGDGKIDFPNDPGCINPQSDTENDDCPDGANCPQCSNGKDDDMNGMTDYPNDPGCESAADPTEFINSPAACGDTLKIQQLPGDGMVTGTVDSMSTTSLTNTCTSGAGSPAIAYIFQLTEPKVVVASTDDSTTNFDTVLSIRPMMCSDAAIACNDNNPDADAVTDNGSKLSVALPAGTYYLIVQGYDAGQAGDFALRVDRFAGEGSTCAVPMDCGPGLVCRIPHGQSAMVCAKPVCNDGVDDDGDGKMDYPADPGCATPDDDSEMDDCPTGPNCPDCADGVDNDMDGMTDYPADTTCHAASNDSESCMSSEGITTLTMPVTNGTIVGATDDVGPTCTTNNHGKDLAYRLDLPALTSLTLNTTGLDTVNSLFDSSCGGTALKCSDPPSFTLPNIAAGTYYYFVDAYSATPSTNTFTVNVSGTIASGASCESALAQSGALTCAAGTACKGAMGARSCQLAQCSDGMDNNSNGKMDYPADPGCDSPSDDTETTVCPGAMCPVCSDGIDNDNDGKIDYPMDLSCVAASGTNEACASTEPVPVLTMPTTTGDTSTATNDFSFNHAMGSTTTCQSSTSTAKDLAYQLNLPALTGLKFVLTETSFFDSSTAFYGAACGAGGTFPQACNDSTTLTIPGPIAAGQYFYVVDGYGSGAGPFSFTVSGTIAGGASCESPLATSGALTCATGFTCKGAAGARVCAPAQCGDGIDNNSDGKIDYPNDPGCSSIADDTETTVCPGAMCPQCSDTTDNDADTLIDYPADFGCAAAGGNTEVFCPTDPDFGGMITMPATQGTLVGAADNVIPTCQPLSEGNDKTYVLQLPVTVASLQIDTLGSTVDDTEVSLKDASCGTTIGCDDDGDPAGLLSLLTVTNVAPGNYAIQVDAYESSSNGPFTLNVKGTVAAGTVCNTPLFTSGVLACASGLPCNATSHKCQ